MTTCYIGLGSNLGDRLKNIEQAIAKISQLKGARVEKISSIIETEPVGGPAQGRFLNAVIGIQTDLSAQELLRSLQNIERDLGRKRLVKNGPRTIDLDILTFGGQKINDINLTVPHPKIKQRDFVLLPLREIAQDIVESLFNEDNKKD